MTTCCVGLDGGTTMYDVHKVLVELKGNRLEVLEISGGEDLKDHTAATRTVMDKVMGLPCYRDILLKIRLEAL